MIDGEMFLRVCVLEHWVRRFGRELKFQGLSWVEPVLVGCQAREGATAMLPSMKRVGNRVADALL